MKNRFQIFATLAFVFVCSAALNSVKAQVSSNTIQEVQLNKNDAFKEIRNLLLMNFDFTNQDYQQGIVNSEVKFDINENGKIVNVHSTGDCKYVSKEIENVLNALQYTIDKGQINDKMLASSFVMPVRVDISNR